LNHLLCKEFSEAIVETERVWMLTCMYEDPYWGARESGLYKSW
jgi:hypothetical protein